MKASSRVLILFAILLSFSTAWSAPMIIFSHSNPNIKAMIEAPADWIEIAWDDDKNAYEIADPNGIVHVLLWFTDTVENSDRYLYKMCDMNDMKFEGKLSRKTINERKYFYGYTTGKKDDKEIKELIAVTSTDHSNIPEHQRLYIIRIWCPLNEFELNERLMNDILNSVKVFKPWRE